jgi:hypothetical protein
MLYFYKNSLHMNRKITLSIVASALVVGAVFINLNKGENQYSPRVASEEKVDGYLAYLNSIRANQITGVVSHEDVMAVRSEIRRENERLNKADWPLNWEFAGPDNIGGRTKALVIDNTNPNILYTGGVSGGIFKSTNKGGSWFPLTLDNDFFGISCMAQTSDGTIFAGTGERGIQQNNAGGQETFTPAFNGSGIYASTDGETFNLLNTSVSFGNINTLVVHPTQTNKILAGTTGALRYSDDGGASWTTIRGGSCKDIAINNNGTALVFIGSVVYRVTDVFDGSQYTTSNIVQGLGGIRRAASAWAHDDDNYCYIVTAGTVSTSIAPANSAGLTGLWRSTDQGVTWKEEVNEASTFFAPFANIGTNTQGVWDMAIAVDPNDKDRVFIGGIEFAEWTLEEGPQIVASKFGSRQNTNYIHSDKHLITFDQSGDYPIMYVCTDGGIFKSTNEELDQYTGINTGFTTTQFYGIAAGRNGRILGGTQDQNSILITNESYPRKKGQPVLSGDGFQAEISEYNPNIMFGEAYNGTVRRSLVGGTEMAFFWDNRIRKAFASAGAPNTIFNSPMELWEEPLYVDSVKNYGYNSDWDNVMKSRLYMPFLSGVFMCNNVLRDAHNPEEASNERIRWFKVSSIGSPSQQDEVSQITSSYDGNHLFFAKNNGRIYRVDNLNAASFDTTSLPKFSDIADTLVTTQINGNLSINGRAFTSIAIDKNDPNRVVITLGNYGNSSFIFVTENALDPSPTWSSIQNNLPRFPVYHAVISNDDPDVIVVGTEYGMWATNNGTSSAPNWVETMTGIDADVPFPSVPVLSVVQVQDKPWSGPVIYAGTHGMGIWKSGSLLSNIKDNEQEAVVKPSISAYPNPANNVLNLSTDIKGSYTLKVYNMKGQAVISNTGDSNGKITLKTNHLSSGNYFVEIVGRNDKVVSKIIVQH